MKTSDFHYALPADRIAKHPLAERQQSKLLCLDPLRDLHFYDLPDLLETGDLLVLNDTKVVKARLHGHKASGAKVECLLERLQSPSRALVHLKTNHGFAPPCTLIFHGQEVQVIGRHRELFEVDFGMPALELFEQWGEVPLPPYLKREANADDLTRYQTVYAQVQGSVAAPTAGLHFTPEILQTLQDKGVQIATITLHVGAGTFKPVSTEKVRDHHMHTEYFHISDALVQAWTQTRQRNKRIIAVGTTSARALESAHHQGQFQTGWQSTQLFITPGYRFETLDGLITNFHLPESTLLMMVCALGGYDAVMEAYRHAVANHYRFFSYGDAMFLTNQSPKALP